MINYLFLHLIFILGVSMYFVGEQALHEFNVELCNLNPNSIIDCENYISNSTEN